MKHIPYATQLIDKADIEAVVGALKSDWLTQGPIVKMFEDRVADHCGAKYAVALSSGTSALHAACFAAGIGVGDEVITSPITFVASSNCVLYCGGKPVFADIDTDTINIDPEEIKKKITPKTKAVIPVHFAGHPCDLEKIKVIAEKNNLIVIEDAAHALGAEYKGSKIGSCKYSDMTVLSFHAVKHITTGEGGMVLTNDGDIYEKLLLFRTHGITREKDLLKSKEEGPWYYEMQSLGFNYRITDFQCALGIEQLKKIEHFIMRRKEIANKYDDAFKSMPGIILPIEKNGVKASWHLYYIRVKNNRRKIFEKMRENNIGVNVHYIPVYRHPYYQQMGYKKGLCPNAEKYYETTITIPLYPKMTDSEVEFIIERITEEIKR